MYECADALSSQLPQHKNLIQGWQMKQNAAQTGGLFRVRPFLLL
jgi:hypothetical protein